MPATGAISRVKLKRRFCPARSSRSLGSSLQRNDAGVWLCEYPGLSFQRSPVCACSLVSSLLLSGATMRQQSSLTQSAHSVRQVLTAYTRQTSSTRTSSPRWRSSRAMFEPTKPEPPVTRCSAMSNLSKDGLNQRSASYPGLSEAAMVHPRGESGSDAVRLDFARRLMLQFRGSLVTSDAGLLAYRELDDVLGLTEMAGDVLADARSGKNGRHALAGLFRQSVFGRLAGYEDVNDAER